MNWVFYLKSKFITDFSLFYLPGKVCFIRPCNSCLCVFSPLITTRRKTASDSEYTAWTAIWWLLSHDSIPLFLSIYLSLPLPLSVVLSVLSARMPGTLCGDCCSACLHIATSVQSETNLKHTPAHAHNTHQTLTHTHTHAVTLAAHTDSLRYCRNTCC